MISLAKSRGLAYSNLVILPEILSSILVFRAGKGTETLSWLCINIRRCFCVLLKTFSIIFQVSVAWFLYFFQVSDFIKMSMK